jgi:mRNA-degrading endonuclease RelE of RelBE toxin-antitoxin system
VRVLVWSKTSGDDLAKVPKGASGRTIDNMVSYCETGEGNVRHLAGKSGQWRLRDGDYRIIFELSDTQVIVKRIAHRREAFREKKTLG